MHELKGSYEDPAQGRPCARPGLHSPANCLLRSVSILQLPLALYESNFSSGSRHSGCGWAATVLSCSLPTAWSSEKTRMKARKARRFTSEPMIHSSCFFTQTWRSRAGLKPKAETGQLIIVQLGDLQAEILEAKLCGKKCLWASGGLDPSYWPSSVPQTPLPGCLAVS